MTQVQWKMDSKVGRLYLVASEKGLQGIFWKKQGVSFAKSLKTKERAAQILAKTQLQLNEYLAGKRKKFSIKLDAQGTAFQKKVWKALGSIPYGRTYSYKDVARRIKNPKAVRAVGTANGQNPLCIVVPCHRVIAADGSIGGYSAGVGLKSRLLRLEKEKS